MSDWIERLREAAITTPDQIRYVFEYGDVSKNVRFKTNRFTFGDKEGSLVQNFGLGEVGFPLQIIFSGPDHDTVANNFEASVAIVGSSLLEHPVYGNADVVIESYTRADPVKTAGNQTLFDMVITETIIPAAPVSTEEGRVNIVNDADEFIDDSAAAFTPNFDSLADQAKSKSRILADVATISDDFKSINEEAQAINDAFNEAESFIIDNIDELLEDPSVLASSIQSLVRIPSRSTANVSSRISTYVSTITKTIQSTILGFGADIYNARLEAQLFLTALMNGTSESALFGTGDFITKADATGAATIILDTYRLLQEFLDTEEQAALGDALNVRYTVDDEVAGGIKNIASLTAGQLVQIAFSLKQERIIILSNDETLIPLVHRLYGGKIDDPVDENIPFSKIDFFIETNELTPDEIILMQKDRQIKYYV